MVFSLAALVFATLFTGAALYISLVEHPARLGLDNGPLLAQWQPSYKRALPIQAGLAVLGGIAGLVAWYQMHDWQSLLGPLCQGSCPAPRDELSFSEGRDGGMSWRTRRSAVRRF